jgi:hypothetical protein
MILLRFFLDFRPFVLPSPQTNAWYRGPTGLIQHFASRGSSFRRNDAACHIIDMVWLYRSPIPVGRRGVFFYLLKWRLPAFAAPKKRGGGVPVCISLKNTLSEKLCLTDMIKYVINFMAFLIRGAENDCQDTVTKTEGLKSKCCQKIVNDCICLHFLVFILWLWSIRFQERFNVLFSC